MSETVNTAPDHAYAIHRLSGLLAGMMIGPKVTIATAEYQAVSRFLTALVVREGETTPCKEISHE